MRVGGGAPALKRVPVAAVAVLDAEQAVARPQRPAIGRAAVPPSPRVCDAVPVFGREACSAG